MVMTMGEIDRILTQYDSTYAGGIGAGSRAFLRRFLEWQAADALEAATPSEREKRLESAVERAAAVFAHYATMHGKKVAGCSTPEEIEAVLQKVARNEMLAAEMRTALAERGEKGK